MSDVPKGIDLDQIVQRYRALEAEIERLREDRECLAYFIENIADQGFEVLRGKDGSWRVVT